MTTIVLGTISLDQMAGGLEKNIVWLANHLARNGHDVRLVTFDYPNATSFYDISPTITWHKVGATKPHSAIGFNERLQLIKRIRSILMRTPAPTVVCFHHGLLPRFLLAALGTKARVICSERNSLGLYRHIRQRKWSLGFFSLALTDAIAVQFQSYVLDYPRWLRGRITVIPNPVSAPQTRASPEKAGPDGRFKVVTVGRLCAQKNQKLLIDVFASLAKEFPEWDLYIIGDGDDYAALARHIAASSLSKRVFLIGKQQDVPSWLASANLFCMPSKWEGFPNALAEAMAHALPCIGYADCPGVRDLIADGETGMLVDRDGLAEGLARLMESAGDRKTLGEASAALIARYDPESSFRKWDELLDR